MWDAQEYFDSAGLAGCTYTNTLFPCSVGAPRHYSVKVFTRLSEQMLSVHSLKAQNSVDLAYDDKAQQTVCCLKNQSNP